MSDDRLDGLLQSSVSLRVGDKTSQGSATCLLDGALGAVADILSVFGETGRTVATGIPFATGGLAPALAIANGQTERAKFRGPRTKLSIAASLCR